MADTTNSPGGPSPPDTRKYKPCGKLPARYVLAILASLGIALAYGMKVAFNIAIVSMVNHTAVHAAVKSSNSSDSDFHSGEEDGPFNWSHSIQGTLLSSYYWGYIVSQIPGGWLAEEYSGKWVFFFAIFINIVGMFILPFLSNLHYSGAAVVRVLQGLGGGTTFPAMHVILAHWVPPKERSIISSMVYSGTALGTVVFIYSTGLLAHYLGWEYIYYVEGAMSAIWLLLWGFLIADSPETLSYITVEEKRFIEASLAEEDLHQVKKHKIPWKSVCTSAPFWAILIAHVTFNWGWYVVLIELPLFMKQVLKFKIKENGMLSALPYMCLWVFSMALGFTLDKLISAGKLNITSARKIATLIATVVPLVCFLLLSFLGDNTVAAVALMTVAVMTSGGMFSGFLSNHIDIASNFAGSLMGITNTVGTLQGIVAPIVVQELTSSDPSLSTWRIIFWISIVFYSIAAVVYGIFGSGVSQKWNHVQ